MRGSSCSSSATGSGSPWPGVTGTSACGCSGSGTSATTTSSTSRPPWPQSSFSSQSAARTSSVGSRSPPRSRRTAWPSVPERPRVLVREPIAESGLELLRSRFEVVEDGESDLSSIIGDFDAIVIRSATRLDAALIERADRLKVIGRAGVGIDNVDVDAATRRGIVVANAPESTVVSAAEQTIGFVVALARNIPQAHAALKQGRWERSRWSGVELAGKTLGMIGFGRIGQQVARRAAGLGMRVVAYDPFVGQERFRELGAERAEAGGGGGAGPAPSS